jgi:hypothetical protein
MTDYDSPWKEALDLFFERFLAYFFPRIHSEIDWSRGHEFLEKEFRQIVREAEIGRRTVDKLVKVWLMDGTESWLLIHIEIQSQYDPTFPKRMFVYNYRLLDYFDRVAVSRAVLADDRPDWRPSSYRHETLTTRTAFEFGIAKLLDWHERFDELEADPNPFAALTLAHLQTMATRQDPENRRGWKMRLFRSLCERDLDRTMVRRLVRLIDWMMDLPESLEKQFRSDWHQFEQEKKMPYVTSFERLAKEEGRVEGRVETLLPAIELALKLRFGAEGLQLMTEIRRRAELHILEAVFQAIRNDATVDDVRSVLV